MNTTKTERTIEQIVQSVTVQELLRTAYSLTHRLHALGESQRKANTAGHMGLSAELVEQMREVRAQRSIVEAEIERRCER